jgi:hypothetical protein
MGPRRTHRLPLAKNAEHQEGFQQEEDANEDQRSQEVKRVQRIAAVGTRECRIPIPGPAEPGVQRDVSRTDEENGSRDEYEAK